ncbi:DNA-binding protein [Candidatus Methylacidiphilum infernorum]|uniref:Plasmid associated KrfA-like protein n=1 Tax=Methylacidiphilum infernorum (isolate V4) TaxID=481448 RepID=B3E0B0_METI4|nr:DNA-binding protein [Candidatus Methylacidiphilum infernorum]ACD84339.1 Plasmid associated KrfA-like protein [Methylacidiphilum infernorum V4]
MSKEKIIEAAEELLAAGKEVTLEAVWQKTGGSYTTISIVLDEWKAKKDHERDQMEKARWSKITEKIKSCNDVDEALDLFQTNFGDVDDISPNSSDEAFYHKDKEKALRESAEWLVARDPVKTISMICNILDSVLERKYNFPEDYSLEWLSEWIPDWTPDLIQLPQQKAKLRELVLVQALYLVSLKAIREKLISPSQVFSILQSQRWRVFKRIELKLCSECEDYELRKKAILDKKNFFDCFPENSNPEKCLLPEYRDLLKENFKNLEEGEKEKIRFWMEEWPRTEQAMQMQNFQNFRKKWKQDLDRCQLFKLIGDKKATYKKEKKLIECLFVKMLLEAKNIDPEIELRWDPKGEEKKPDVTFEINGRRVWVEVTELYPDEGDRGSPARKEAETSLAAWSQPAWIATNWEKTLQEGVKEKICKGKEYLIDPQDDLWLLVVTSIPQIEKLKATMVALHSLDQVKLSVDDLLNDPRSDNRFDEFYFFPIVNIGNDNRLYSWSRGEGWKELRVQVWNDFFS